MRKKHKRNQQIANAYIYGNQSMAEIAAEHGISRMRVWQIINKETDGMSQKQTSRFDGYLPGFHCPVEMAEKVRVLANTAFEGRISSLLRQAVELYLIKRNDIERKEVEGS